MKHAVKNNKIYQPAIVTKMIVAALLFLSITSGASAQAQASREYDIKAVFLYNFTQFIEWPPDAFSSAESPFVIGILGDNPFQSSLDATVSGEKVNGHSIVVQYYHDVKDIRNCHILYINPKEAVRVKEILSSISNKNVLTVSDIPNFARTGGIIHFLNQNNKIRLQINAAAAKAAELNISSKLLRVAEIVDNS